MSIINTSARIYVFGHVCLSVFAMKVMNPCYDERICIKKDFFNNKDFLGPDLKEKRIKFVKDPDCNSGYNALAPPTTTTTTPTVGVRAMTVFHEKIYSDIIRDGV